MTAGGLRAVCICFVSLAAVAHAAAQTVTGDGRYGAATPHVQTSGPSPLRTSADEIFELNIIERRITERDFGAATAVGVGDEAARGINLRVGVSVTATEIDILLRNVRGDVRFRATLDAVLLRINSRRNLSPTER